MTFKMRSSDIPGELEKRAAQGAAGEPAKGSAEDPQSRSGVDAAVERALRDFRVSVHAWSEAAYHRPRTAVATAPRRTAWRKAAACALGSVLVAGIAGGGYLEYQHRQEQARVAAAREAEHQSRLAEQKAREAEEELAKVDSDISQEVPDAMEPLVQMAGDDSR